MEISNKLSKIDLSSYILMGLLIIAVFLLKLAPAVTAGLIVYLSVKGIFDLVQKLLNKKKIKDLFFKGNDINTNNNTNRITILLFSGIILVIISLIGLGLYNSVRYGTENIEDLTRETLSIVAQLKNYLPENLVNLIPKDMMLIKQKGVDVLQSNVSNIFSVTASSFKTATQILLGMVIGAIVAFSEVGQTHAGYKPFSQALLNRIYIFCEQFSKLIVSQVKISLINTALTAIYLLVVLPIFGVNMPYKITLLLVTFLCGLMPVIGGIISNSLIIILSLTISIKVVISSIVFLFLVNLSEYYTNAKIVGGEMKTSMWELLCAMIVMEVVFGMWGIILAPVIYGYIKEELKIRELV